MSLTKAEVSSVGLASLLAAVEDIDVVGQASSGALGVRSAGDVHPDVVLLALSLPDGGASAVTRQIVAQHPGVRVVLLVTGEAGSGIGTALSAGACGYVTKDAPLEEIVAAIRAAARGGTWRAPRTAQTRRERLTPRELEVLEFLRRGLTASAIAAKFEISPAVHGRFDRQRALEGVCQIGPGCWFDRSSTVATH